ncbi:MAG: hypothetical protein IJQ60_02880 [Prevotella sp.]|nr:hypothetical protein [Prevotella sp.]
MKNYMYFCMMVAIVSMLFSCDRAHDYGPEQAIHNLCISVKNSEGKDLVKDLPLTSWYPDDQSIENAISGKFDENSYKVYCIPDNAQTPRVYDSQFSMCKSLYGDWLIRHETFISNWQQTQQEYTFQILCPSLFGNHETHVLKTYWTIPTEKYQGKHFAICSKAIFDGNEVMNINYTDQPNGFNGEKTNIVTIVVQ